MLRGWQRKVSYTGQRKASYTSLRPRRLVAYASRMSVAQPPELAALKASYTSSVRPHTLVYYYTVLLYMRPDTRKNRRRKWER